MPTADPAAQTRRTLYRLYLWLIMLIEDKGALRLARTISWAIEQFQPRLAAVDGDVYADGWDPKGFEALGVSSTN
ncbi:MAG: hypothetical protein IPM76_27815 [Chloroflexi bacterium]|nr:hypothetical protein [Chloroflexota bacterium]